VTPVIRLAVEADAEHLEQLEREAQGNTAGARGAAALFAEQPDGILANDEHGFTIVATVDGVVVGMATLRIALVQGQRIATVVRVFVTAPARQVGIGDALINASKDAARQRGCVRIDALSLPGDRETKNLYERNGLTARLIVAANDL